MVILFVAPLYEEKGVPPKGGVSMYLRRVTGALNELGHSTIILSIGTKNRHYIENGTEIYFVSAAFSSINNKYLNIISRLIKNNIIVNRKIKELLKTREIDMIQFASIWGLSAGYFGNTPAVMRMSIYSKVYREYKNDKMSVDIKAFLERMAVKRCNAVFSPSNVIAEAFSKDIHRKVSVIETPFWNESQEYDNSIYRKELEGKKYFLFFGRMVVDKGIYVLAECLYAFLQQNPEYYFVCCGIEEFNDDENPVSALTKAAGKYVSRFIYMKSLPHSSLYPVIKHADFVVFPSLIDNFSNACIEAMYFERVVIGTDGTSYEQLIDDGRSGFLCKPNDAGSVLEKMNEAASMDGEQKARMGKRAGMRIERLRPEIVVKKLVRYYQYVIDNADKKKCGTACDEKTGRELLCQTLRNTRRRFQCSHI